MIYLLTAIGLTPDGSSTVHTHTHTHTHTQKYMEHTNTLGATRLKYYTLVYPELFWAPNKNELASSN